MTVVRFGYIMSTMLRSKDRRGLIIKGYPVMGISAITDFYRLLLIFRTSTVFKVNKETELNS
jgi:hypothetical protein